MPFAVPQQQQAQPDPNPQPQMRPAGGQQMGQVQQPQRQADPWGGSQRGYGSPQPVRRPQQMRGYAGGQRGYGRQMPIPQARPAAIPQPSYGASIIASNPGPQGSGAFTGPGFQQPQMQNGYADGMARRSQEAGGYGRREPQRGYGAPPPIQPSYGYGGWDKGPVSDYREAQPQYSEEEIYNKRY